MVHTIAIFGIGNRGIDTGVKVLLLFLFVVWAALIFWTYADARRRIDDPMLVACATAASLFPFVGSIVYAIVRPPEFLDDVHLRELELHAAEGRMHQVDWELCPNCDYEISPDYLLCPSCLRRLREPCHACAKPLDPRWRVCPFCETDVGAAPRSSAAPPGSASSRRRRSTAETPAVDLPPQ